MLNIKKVVSVFHLFDGEKYKHYCLLKNGKKEAYMNFKSEHSFSYKESDSTDFIEKINENILSYNAFLQDEETKKELIAFARKLKNDFANKVILAHYREIYLSFKNILIKLNQKDYELESKIMKLIQEVSVG